MELLNVEPFQETLNAGMCGPASLKMALEYWGLSMTEKELAKLCGTEPALGTNDISFQRVAKSLGFEAEIKNDSSFDDIQHWLNKKTPLIVDWLTKGRNDAPDSEVPDGHYSVVIGLDAEYIYLQDPEIGGLRKIKREDFLKVWFDFTGEYIKSWDEMIIRQIIAIYPAQVASTK